MYAVRVKVTSRGGGSPVTRKRRGGGVGGGGMKHKMRDYRRYSAGSKTVLLEQTALKQGLGTVWGTQYARYQALNPLLD